MTGRVGRPTTICQPPGFFKRRGIAAPAPASRSVPGRGVFVAAASGLTLIACGSGAASDFGPAPSGLRISSDTSFYDVRGVSPHDLEVAMVMHGPEVEGHPRYAATAFTIQWSFGTRSSAAGCAVRRPRIDLEMVVHLPRWVDRDQGASELREAWDGFLDAIETHERGHQQANVDGGTRMLRELRQARSAGGCADLRRAVEPRLRALLAEVHTANERYDIETGGGARMGVRWPPPR